MKRLKLTVDYVPRVSMFCVKNYGMSWLTHQRMDFMPFTQQLLMLNIVKSFFATMQ